MPQRVAGHSAWSREGQSEAVVARMLIGTAAIPDTRGRPEQFVHRRHGAEDQNVTRLVHRKCGVKHVDTTSIKAVSPCAFSSAPDSWGPAGLLGGPEIAVS